MHVSKHAIVQMSASIQLDSFRDGSPSTYNILFREETIIIIELFLNIFNKKIFGFGFNVANKLILEK